MIRHIESGIAGKGLSKSFLSEIKDLGKSLGVEGSVFTKDDGSIKIVAEGPEENLVVFSERLPKISMFFSVENFYIKWLEPPHNCVNF